MDQMKDIQCKFKNSTPTRFTKDHFSLINLSDQKSHYGILFDKISSFQQSLQSTSDSISSKRTPRFERRRNTRGRIRKSSRIRQIQSSKEERISSDELSTSSNEDHCDHSSDEDFDIAEHQQVQKQYQQDYKKSNNKQQTKANEIKSLTQQQLSDLNSIIHIDDSESSSDHPFQSKPHRFLWYTELLKKDPANDKFSSQYLFILGIPEC